MKVFSASLSLTSALLLTVALAGCSNDVRPPELPDYSPADLDAQTAADNQRALDALLSDFPDAEVPEVD